MQSSLLKYWEFQPDFVDSEASSMQDKGTTKHSRRRKGSDDTQNSSNTRVERVNQDSGSKSRWGFRSWGKGRATNSKGSTAAPRSPQPAHINEPVPLEAEKQENKERPAKKVPVRIILMQGLIVKVTLG